MSNPTTDAEREAITHLLAAADAAIKAGCAEVVVVRGVPPPTRWGCLACMGDIAGTHTIIVRGTREIRVHPEHENSPISILGES